MKILEKWLQITKTKSSGPGGQNVNKINSKICMKLPLFHLSQDIRDNIYKKYKNKINSSAELYAFSDKFRSQEENYKNCFSKLQDIVDDCRPLIRKECQEKTDKIKEFKLVYERNRKKSKVFNSIKKSFRKLERSESYDRF
jgi:protein subunit release factor B